MASISREWLKAAGIRALKTVAQTALSMLAMGQAVIDIDWPGVVSVSAVAGLISILTSVAGLPEVSGKGEPDGGKDRPREH